jgi:predicted membrane protein
MVGVYRVDPVIATPEQFVVHMMARCSVTPMLANAATTLLAGLVRFAVETAVCTPARLVVPE